MLTGGSDAWGPLLQEKYTFVVERRDAKSIIEYLVYIKEMKKQIESIKTGHKVIGTHHRLMVEEMNWKPANKANGIC